MESLGAAGVALGTMGLILALSAQARISKLEKQLKAAGVLDEDFDSEKREE